VLVLVHLVIAARIGLWLASGKSATLTPVEPAEAARFARESVINAGLVFFALTILSTLVLGRWFCGWACHLVALQDGCRWLLLKVGITPRPLRSRWMAIVPLLAALYLFVWPIVPRLLAGEDLAFRGFEFTRSGFWDTFPSWIPAVITFVVCGGLSVYFLGAKGFCTYGCPYGAIFGLADRVAPGRIRVTDACKRCGHCTLVCTSNVDVAREVHEYGMVVDPGCMKCFDCVTVCPEDALYFGLGRPALGAKPRVERTRKPVRLPGTEELVVVAACLFAYFAIRGFFQGGGLLLSVGVATTFGGLALFAVRLKTRADVALPGLDLKSAGRVRPAGFALLGVVALTVSLAVPFGLVPEWAAWRASRAFTGLEEARARWEAAAVTFGSVDLDPAVRASAARLTAAAARVDRGAWVVSQHNAVRAAWGHLLAGERGLALEPLEVSLTVGEPHPLLWMLLGDAATAPGARPGREAVEDYSRALQMQPDYTPVQARLVHTLVRSATDPEPDPELARRVLAALEGARWSGADGAVLRGEVAFYRYALGESSDLHEVEGALRDALVAEPQRVEVRLKLASILAEAGDLRAALGVLNAAPGASAQDSRITSFASELRAALGG